MIDRIEETIIRIVFVVACLPLISGLLMFVRQILDWLETGVWRSVSFRETLEANRMGEIPRVSWVGVQKIIDWGLDLPAPIGLAATSAVAVCGVMYFFSLSESA